MEPKPSVGRIVHFYENPGDKPQAAIICDVIDGSDQRLNLAVFDSHANVRAPQTSVPRAVEGSAGRCWNWPERV